MKCDLEGCPNRADPNGGNRCELHAPWTADLLARALRAIEQAIVTEDGLDGREGEAILRAVGYWPRPERRVAGGAAPVWPHRRLTR